VQCAELFNIAGQGAIVTGAGSGLGLAIAAALAESGARVTLLDVDAGRIASETERLRRLGYAVRGEVVDVSDHAALERAFDAALAALGRLDIVFANAGIAVPGTPFAVTRRSVASSAIRRNTGSARPRAASPLPSVP